jgi:hypothetical protein
VLPGVGVARLDGVGERAHRRLVGAPQLLGAGALAPVALAQVGGVALELALVRGGLALGALEAGSQLGDGVGARARARAEGTAGTDVPAEPCG